MIVDLKLCNRTDKTMTTSLNIGMVREDGERTFVTNRNGSLWKMGLESIDLEKIKNAKILSLASIFNNPLLNNDALVKIFKKAKKEKMIICADMVKSRLGETLDDIKEALSYVDYFFPNYEEAAELTGKTELSEIADTFLTLGVKNVLIKVGKKGCYIKNTEIEKIVPAFKKDASVSIDTIGAGDNFVSGFISELLKGKTFEECAYFGNAVAAVSIESLGATTGVKSRQQVEEMIKNYK
ncbi:carbohydrate kinase family protein [Enterococcus faecium]|uniref:carbohydrate kinase family protein n=1 Tax=Enterococcus faecium TaxID=1352 RepID=UPI00215A5C4C|nr:carbohydrate kinase family protein [Enterococcus faecium]